MNTAKQLLAVQTTTDTFLDDSLTSSDWIAAAVILVGSLLIAIIMSRVLRRVFAHGLGPGFASILMARLASYAIFLIGLFYSLTSLGVRVGPLLGALGLGGLVVALALQGVVENFVSSIILQARRPFTVGDSVELDGRIGIVADIDSRTTLLHAVDGSQVRIPNANVASSTIVNLTREPVRRSTLDVGVSYDTDLQAAQLALLGAIARVPRVLSEPPPAVNITGFDDSSIGFRLYYWHDSDIPSELAARTDLAIAVHQALSADDITIAFPQVVVWSGQDDADPYDRPPEIVDTPYPGLGEPDAPSRKPFASPLRRPIRRKAE